MSARRYVTLTASVVLLSGCLQLPAADQSFVIAPGAVVPAGIPCGHVVSDRRASVPGCETFMTIAGPDMVPDQLIDLNTRFRQEVQVIVNFDFDSDDLRPDASAILDRQAEWIVQYPELRFSVYGHTDLVGSLDYNFDLAKRRADAAVAYLLTRGVAQKQLESVVSFGKTQPVMDTPSREEQNRRTVTEVSGFLRLAGRTTVPVPCDWIDVAYLPTYHQCITPRSIPVPLPAPVPPPAVPPQILDEDYIGDEVRGIVSITRNPDGSVTRRAEGSTGSMVDPRTYTVAESTTKLDGSVGLLWASYTIDGKEYTVSSTPNTDGTRNVELTPDLLP